MKILQSSIILLNISFIIHQISYINGIVISASNGSDDGQKTFGINNKTVVEPIDRSTNVENSVKPISVSPNLQEASSHTRKIIFPRTKSKFAHVITRRNSFKGPDIYSSVQNTINRNRQYYNRYNRHINRYRPYNSHEQSEQNFNELNNQDNPSPRQNDEVSTPPYVLSPPVIQPPESRLPTLNDLFSSRIWEYLNPFNLFSSTSTVPTTESPPLPGSLLDYDYSDESNFHPVPRNVPPHMRRPYNHPQYRFRDTYSHFNRGQLRHNERPHHFNRRPPLTYDELTEIYPDIDYNYGNHHERDQSKKNPPDFDDLDQKDEESLYMVFNDDEHDYVYRNPTEKHNKETDFRIFNDLNFNFDIKPYNTPSSDPFYRTDNNFNNSLIIDEDVNKFANQYEGDFHLRDDLYIGKDGGLYLKPKIVDGREFLSESEKQYIRDHPRRSFFENPHFSTPNKFSRKPSVDFYDFEDNLLKKRSDSGPIQFIDSPNKTSVKDRNNRIISRLRNSRLNNNKKNIDIKVNETNDKKLIVESEIYLKNEFLYPDLKKVVTDRGQN